MLFSCSHFDVRNIAKTNVDVISEIHMNQVKEILWILTEKLYKKNPKELQKNKNLTLNKRLNEIFSCPPKTKLKEVESKNSIDAILLGFDPKFKGDRVFALMYGLYTMIHRSYNDKCELFVLDYLNAQSLYNSARNIEIFLWQIKNKRDKNGKLFILTNSVQGKVQNLSYERLFGKLIALQDIMALIIERRTGRIAKRTAQIAGMVFLPIGF